MSVSPLDLQTLYSNLKNVGQQHAAERASEIASQDKKADELVRKADERDHKVAETKDLETGIDKINEDEHNNRQGSGQKEKEQQQEAEEQTAKKKYFEDPEIGSHIDISG